MPTVYDITAAIQTFITEHPKEFPDTTWYDEQISVLNDTFCDIECSVVSAIWKYKFTRDERKQFIIDYYDSTQDQFNAKYNYVDVINGDFIPDELPLTVIFHKLFID